MEKMLPLGSPSPWEQLQELHYFSVLCFGAQEYREQIKGHSTNRLMVNGMEGTPWKCPAGHCPSHACISVFDTLTLLHHTWNFDLLASQSCGPSSVVGARAQS